MQLRDYVRLEAALDVIRPRFVLAFSAQLSLLVSGALFLLSFVLWGIGAGVWLALTLACEAVVIAWMLQILASPDASGYPLEEQDLAVLHQLGFADTPGYALLEQKLQQRGYLLLGEVEASVNQSKLAFLRSQAVDTSAREVPQDGAMAAS